MTEILLIYPFFLPRHDRSVFRFPPLGISYLAASLQRAGHNVQLLDCTFLTRGDALEKARAIHAPVVGIYCMVTLEEDCLKLARELRTQTQLLIAGGPLPSCDPKLFLEDFDVVVQGEGELTLPKLLEAYEKRENFKSVEGIIYSSPTSASPKLISNPPRPFIKDLDKLHFPARDLLPNTEYQKQGKEKYGYSITSIMSSRGCPYRCDFCSNVVFGGSYRERSAKNVVDEIEQVLALRYDRVSFADDVFTMNKTRVKEICKEIQQRKLTFKWECLGRVDSMDEPTARQMKQAGCTRIYFGIESGDPKILALMNKKITLTQASDAVSTAQRAGLEVGAFFILGYPGETNETILRTLRFAASLKTDYLGLTLPYPLPGTGLYDRVKKSLKREWHPPENGFFSHTLIFRADFSSFKLQFAILKGKIQWMLKKKFTNRMTWLPDVFERSTDWIFRLLK